jgi:flagellin-like protein
LRKRDSKGVSEIVATVLMIMIVTAIGFAIFLYGMGFFTATSSARDTATQTGIATLRERFIIVDVAMVNNSYVSVWVYNYGETNVAISSVYLNAVQLNITTSNNDVYPGALRQINATMGVVQPGAQLVRIVSTLGNYYENYYQS